MFTAAKLGNKGIVRLLASHTYAALTEAALEASKAFPARVVDFTPRAPSEPNATGFKASSHKKIRVHHLLAGEYEVTPDFPLYSAAGSDEQLRGFRWIHLPANNTAWCQELLVRRFIEQDAADPDSFKALETAFTHEHIGTKLHARYMRPTCRLIHRAENATHFGKHSPNSTWLKRKGKRNAGAKPKLNQGGSSVEGLQVDDDFGLAGVDFPSPSDGHSRKPSQSNIIKEAPFNNSKVDSLSTNDEHTNVTDSMYLYMPYVHFEWTEALRKMQKEVTTARAKRSTSTMYDARHKIATRNPSIPGRRVQQRWSTFRGNASGAHRDLIHAHVDASICSLHVRRTLDQFFYRTIDTSFRDKDQVVLRHQRSHCKNDCELHQCNCDNQKREHSKAECDKAQGCTCNAKILMVDQLWMWIVSSDLIITSFPQRWDQSASDLDDVYEGILNDITAATHKDISDVYELAMIITSRCTGALHFEYTNVGETLFLDVFESAIGHAMNWETKLFAKFEKASHEASKWLRNRRTLPGGPLTIMREDIMTDDNDKTGDHDWTEEDPRLQDSGAEPPFIQTLLDIRDETLLLREIKDIRDELEMLKLIFTQQQKVCEEARKGIMGALERHQAGHHQRERLQRLCDEQQRRINNPLKDVERMLSQTERIYKSNKDLLDLKQKYANALQASDTARQGQTLMVFTIVTVVFLPLSFTAAFFAIPIESFPHNSQHAVDMSLEYVSKYVFGVGIAIALPCVVVALTVKQIVLFAKERQRGLRLLFRHIPRALTRAAPQPSSDGSPPAVDAPVQGASVPNGESKPIGPPANPGRSILHWMRLRQGSRNDGDVGESHTVNGNV
jgi:Mg2+ and Co2+ transporter CorA